MFRNGHGCLHMLCFSSAGMFSWKRLGSNWRSKLYWYATNLIMPRRLNGASAMINIRWNDLKHNSKDCRSLWTTTKGNRNPERWSCFASWCFFMLWYWPYKYRKLKASQDIGRDPQESTREKIITMSCIGRSFHLTTDEACVQPFVTLIVAEYWRRDQSLSEK